MSSYYVPGTKLRVFLMDNLTYFSWQFYTAYDIIVSILQMGNPEDRSVRVFAMLISWEVVEMGFESRQPSSRGHTVINESSSANSSFRPWFTHHPSWEFLLMNSSWRAHSLFWVSTTFCFSTQPNILGCSCWFPCLWVGSPCTVSRLLKGRSSSSYQWQALC